MLKLFRQERDSDFQSTPDYANQIGDLNARTRSLPGRFEAGHNSFARPPIVRRSNEVRAREAGQGHPRAPQLLQVRRIRSEYAAATIGT